MWFRLRAKKFVVWKYVLFSNCDFFCVWWQSEVGEVKRQKKGKFVWKMSDHLQTTAAMGFIKSMLVGFNVAFWVSRDAPLSLRPSSKLFFPWQCCYSITFSLLRQKMENTVLNLFWLLRNNKLLIASCKFRRFTSGFGCFFICETKIIESNEEICIFKAPFP